MDNVARWKAPNACSGSALLSRGAEAQARGCLLGVFTHNLMILSSPIQVSTEQDSHKWMRSAH
jgi:hypothetical protein